MSIKFELDNGKLKQYTTLMTEYGSEGYYPEKPYYTKCGLSFKNFPKDGACDHIECALYAAKREAFYPITMFCFFSIIMIAAYWYENRDLIRGIQESEGFLIMFGPLSALLSIPVFKQWLELREYMNHGTIHGKKARRSFFEDEIILRLQTDKGEIREYKTAYVVGCKSREGKFFDYGKWAYKCGTRWPKEPCQECAPLECAIYKAEKNWRRNRINKLFFAAIAVIFLPILAVAEHRLIPLIIFVLSATASIVVIGFGQDYKDCLDELNEFKNNETIEGIRAWKIS
jgi:hypothetical protein